MYKLIFFILISGAALISAESSSTHEAYEPSENSVTTKTHRHEFEEILTDFEIFDNATVVTEPTKHESNDTSVDTTINDVEKVTESFPTTTQPTTALPKFNRAEAEAEIKGWSDKLDCENSPLGEFKCALLKKLIKKFFETAEGIESKKLTTRIKSLVKKLEDSDTLMDPDMRNLIKKYKVYLN